MRFLAAFFGIFLSAAAFGEAVSVTAFAGSDGGGGYRDGTGNFARFDATESIAVDASGNIFVADRDAFTVRRITPAGVVTTLAGVAGETGYVDGQGGNARFYALSAVAVDSAGNVYVAEQSHVRKISPAGNVTTLHASAPTTGGLAVDSSGNVFLTDLFHSTIQKINPAGEMTAFAGTDSYPRGLAIDGSNNLYFTTDAGTIYKCTPQGTITTVATVTYPHNLDVDGSGNLYVSASDRILKISNGNVSEFAGSLLQGYADGFGGVATFTLPRGVAVSPDGSLVYVGDFGNHTIRRITTTPSVIVSTFAGRPSERAKTDGTGLNARFSNPNDVVLAPDGNLYVVDAYNALIRKITPAGVTTTFAGGSFGNQDGTGTGARFQQPARIAVGYDGADWVLYLTDVGNNNVRRITQGAVVTTIATGISRPNGIAVDAAGDVYVSATMDCTIRKIDMPAGTMTVFAGTSGTPGSIDGTGTSSSFRGPSGLTIDGSGKMYVADTSNHLIRQIVLSTAAVTKLAGTGFSGTADGVGTAASFSNPLAVHSVGNDLYVSDGSQLLRLIQPGAVVTTVAGKALRFVNRDGTGTIARFAQIGGIGGDSSTNLYVCDLYGNNIRKVRVPGISDVATVSTPAPNTYTVVQLDTSPATATSWTWSIERRPTGSTAELSATNVRNPTFTPDVAERYTFLLRAEGPGGIRYSTVDIVASVCADPLTSVVASTATQNVCGATGNGTATVSVTGGETLAYQWGYRTASGGAITPISGATSSSYSINGYDFGGSGDRFLVVTVTPTCGSIAVSNELPLNVSAPAGTINASSAVYAGSTQNFASVPDSGAGATYTWGITNGTITSGQGTRSIAYTAGASGTVALTVSVSLSGCIANGNANVPIQTRPTGATMLYIVTPCRIADTRDTSALAHGETRDFAIGGLCGIPPDASAVVANITAVTPIANGFLALWPAGTTWSGTSTMNYRTGKTRANNAVIPLPGTGQVSVLNNGASQHIIIDVTGYFR